MASKDRNLNFATSSDLSRPDASGQGESAGRVQTFSAWQMLLLLLMNALLIAALGWWLDQRMTSIIARQLSTAEQSAAVGAKVKARADDTAANIARAIEQLDQWHGESVEQHRLLAQSLQDVQQSVAELREQVRASAVKTTGATAPPAEPAGWVINVSGLSTGHLADFSALVTRLGYTLAKPKSSDEAGGDTAGLRVVGFRDRKSAESAAKALMKNSDVGGLWVGRD